MEKKTASDEWVPSVCYMCPDNCGIKVHRIDGVVVKIEGNPDNPHNLGRICAKGNSGLMNLYDPYRVKVPLKRTNPEKGIGVDPQWVEITWEEALNTIAERLKKVRAEDPRKLVIASLDYFVTGQVNAYASAFGTPNIWGGGAGYFCGNGVHPVTYLTTGTFYDEPDLHYCNYCLLIGSQFGFNLHHEPMLKAQEMADARLRGMRLVVVDPYGSNAAAKADEWIPIRPGTDAALALAMINVLINELGLYDGESLRKYTNGPYLIRPDGHYLRDEGTSKPLVWDLSEGKAKTFDAGDGKDFALEGTYIVDGVEVKPAFQLLKANVRKYPPEEVSKITTIPAETIRRIAREFGEAARIGSTIVIEGKQFPFRPVAVDFSRGAVAHKHGMLTGLAIQLLNIVVGALDVPGGYLSSPGAVMYENSVGPSWSAQEGPDGLLVPARYLARSLFPYPAREVKPPETVELMELCPVGPYSRPFFVVYMLNPEKFKLPYKPEVMLHCRTNVMLSCTNPEETAEALRRIPFIFSIARELDETVEFADIVLPDSHYLERLDPFVDGAGRSISAGQGHWYWEIAQPVAEPPPGVRHWFDTLIEIADRVGFLRDFYQILNTTLYLKEPLQLDLNKKYTWAELGDKWAKSTFGPEHGLDWFKEHGFIKWPKKIEEAYPRLFIKPRIPIYYEYFLGVREKLQQVTEGMGLSWDVSDYQPLPDWKPCPAHEVSGDGYDLIAINYKMPFHTFSYTAENPWLDDLAQRHPYAYNVVMHREVAERKGIRDGEEVWVEAITGDRVRGRVKVGEVIHPEVVAIGGNFGHWAKGEPVARGKGIHFNRLLTVDLNRIDMVSTAVDSCVRVKVYADR